MTLGNGDPSFTLHIREYTPDDLDACLDIFTSNLDALPDLRDHFAEFLMQGTSWFLVVEHNGRAAACGGLEISGDTNASRFLFGIVHKDHQRQGIGTILTLTRLLLVPTDEPPALVAMEAASATESFYTRFGFERMMPHEKRRHDFASYVDLGLWLTPERQEEIRATLTSLPVSYADGILPPA